MTQHGRPPIPPSCGGALKHSSVLHVYFKVWESTHPQVYRRAPALYNGLIEKKAILASYDAYDMASRVVGSTI